MDASVEEARRDEAVEWLLRLEEGELDASEERDFATWRSDPARAELLERLGEAARAFGIPRQMGLDIGALLRRADQAGVRRRTFLKGAGGAALALPVAAWMTIRSFERPGDQASLTTDIGMRKTVALADRSSMTLNADTAAKVDMAPDARRVYLMQGRLLVHVAPDPSRPFTVETKLGAVRALGTIFQVTVNANSVEIAVIESRVEVRPRDGGNPVVLSAGERLRLGEGAIGQKVPVRATETEWTSGVYVADDTRLDEVVDNLRPYMRDAISVDPQVASLRVSGVFPLDRPIRALDALQSVVDIQVVHSGSRTSIIPR